MQKDRVQLLGQAELQTDAVLGAFQLQSFAVLLGFHTDRILLSL
jgi:hypothetical protein